MSELQAAIEAIIYAAEEPPTAAQLASALLAGREEVEAAIAGLQQRYASDDYGVEVRAVAGGYRIATKPQHHDSVRQFLKSIRPPIRLSLAALETLAVIAYRQPITLPEVREIRGVDPAGVINTLLDKKLVTTAGRKEVIGKPILYRTTRDFLKQFGLNSLRDLPTLKEFEEMAQAGLEGLEEQAPEAAEASAEVAADEAAASQSATNESAVDEISADGDQSREADPSGDFAPSDEAFPVSAAGADPVSPPAPEPGPSTGDPTRSGAASPEESSD